MHDSNHSVIFIHFAHKIKITFSSLAIMMQVTPPGMKGA